MIINQDMDVDLATGDVKLRNTFDISMAKSLAKDVSNEGGEHHKDMHCMGYIPPEMWRYDPWLIEARKAQLAHDDYEFQKYLRKFFDIHTALKVHNKQKYFRGW